MPGTTAILFGDQLHAAHPALVAADQVLMVESEARLRRRRWHAQKLIFVLSAMRHQAERLRAVGMRVDYRRATSFREGLAAHIAAFRPARLVVMEPAEYPAARAIQRWHAWLDEQGIVLDVLPHTAGFTCTRDAFADWAAGQKRLQLERFYRWQRARLGVLMDDGKPAGGRWNFDAENRLGAKKLPAAPLLPRVEPDAITQAVIAEVVAAFPDSFGDPEPFVYPVTHADAEAWLASFIEERLPAFGPWQDAVQAENPFLFHGVVALLLNIGLLEPRTVVARVEAAYRAGRVSLQSAEGFIRQVIGWREYVYGIYWLHMPAYMAHNFFDHHQPLPAFLWSGQTEMRCIAATVADLRRHAYTHHIPRLMLVANLGNLAGIDPAALTEWFLTVYIDAYDWVMWPNVLGLGLYADGGLMASKPYVASAAYIRKMTAGYCDRCRYDASARTGPDACPFNALYWDFLARHRDRLASNQRMALALKGVDRRADLPAIQERAGALLREWFPEKEG